MRCFKARERIGTVDVPAVVVVQVVLQVQSQVLTIEIEHPEVVIAKPILIEGQGRSKIPSGIGDEGGAHSAIPEKVALLAIADEKGIAREIQRLGGEEGKHLRPGR